MKTGISKIVTKYAVLAIILFSSITSNGQDDRGFWQRVRFGGAVGAGFGNGYTNVSLAPAAIYEFNEYVGLGLGLQGSYIKDKGYYADYSAWMYGGSLISVLNPIPQLQLSAELEQLRVNLDVDHHTLEDYTDNFWNTALFLGAGYRANNVVLGVRYNVLFNEDDFVYSTAFMPFVRLYF